MVIFLCIIYQVDFTDAWATVGFCVSVYLPGQ